MGERALDLGGLNRLLVDVNAERFAALEASAAPGAAAAAAATEALIETLFAASQRLFVYGSLAPGESNYHELAGLEGSWYEGWVRGESRATGWGSELGFPALRWDPEGTRISGKLFVSRDLPAQRARLDEFEGAEYGRILVPVHDASGLLGVANVYAARG